jgi:hypothetical protein
LAANLTGDGAERVGSALQLVANVTRGNVTVAQLLAADVCNVTWQGRDKMEQFGEDKKGGKKFQYSPLARVTFGQ